MKISIYILQYHLHTIYVVMFKPDLAFITELAVTYYTTCTNQCSDLGVSGWTGGIRIRIPVFYCSIKYKYKDIQYYRKLLLFIVKSVLIFKYWIRIRIRFFRGRIRNTNPNTYIFQFNAVLLFCLSPCMRGGRT